MVGRKTTPMPLDPLFLSSTPAPKLTPELERAARAIERGSQPQFLPSTGLMWSEVQGKWINPSNDLLTCPN